MDAIAAFGSPDSPPAGNDGMTPQTITAMECLTTAVREIEGCSGDTCIRIDTRFRSQPYQNHLVAVWEQIGTARLARWNGSRCITVWDEAECQAVRLNHLQECMQHFPMGAPAKGVSNHTNGNAFDATVRLPAGRDIKAIIAAAGCNLTMPVANERWHFER